jgi:microsomal dipeptidase-like Zn-dependent dipeptidase
VQEFKIYITAQTDDDFPYVLKYAGEDNVVIGTDYGHTDASSEVDAIEVFARMIRSEAVKPDSRRQPADSVRALRKTAQYAERAARLHRRVERQSPDDLARVTKPISPRYEISRCSPS